MNKPAPNGQIIQAKLLRDISTLFEVHNRTLSAAAHLRWVSKLLPYAEKGDLVGQILDKACDGKQMPSLEDILERLWSSNRAVAQRSKMDPPQTTSEQKRRADHAGIMSALWFRYHYGARGLGDEIMMRCFSDLVDDPEKAMAVAMEAYPQEVVDKWMADQERNSQERDKR